MSNLDLEKRIAELEKERDDLRLFLNDARSESTMYEQGVRVERDRWLDEMVEVVGDPETESQFACMSLLHGHRVRFKNGLEARRYAARVMEVRGTGPLMPWGKHRSKRMGDMPASYVFWLLNSMQANGVSFVGGRGSRDDAKGLLVGVQLYELFTPPVDVEYALDLTLNVLTELDRSRALKWAAQQEYGKFLLAWLGWERCRHSFKVL